MIKKIYVFDYYFEEIGAGAAWLICDFTCPNCEQTKHVKTLDYWNCECMRTCDCGKKLILDFSE